MYMKKFNFQEYLKNPTKKVVTDKGLSVKIIYTRRKDKSFNKHIIFLIDTLYSEEVFYCADDGKYSQGQLYFAAEKRSGWINIYPFDSCLNGSSTGNLIYVTKEEALKNADSSVTDTIFIEWEE